MYVILHANWILYKLFFPKKRKKKEALHIDNFTKMIIVTYACTEESTYYIWKFCDFTF